jgi:hypothetical protein
VLIPLNRNLKIAAAISGLALFVAGGLWYDSRGGDDGVGVAVAAGRSSTARVSNAKTPNVDPCSFLTTEDIEAATGLKGMKAHDQGTSSGTGARVCKYDQGTGELPTLTVFVRPTAFEGRNGGKTTYVEYAQQNYKGEALAGVGDAAFMTSKGVYIQKGDITLEISTLVMNGYLPGHILGEPLKDLAQRAAATPAS